MSERKEKKFNAWPSNFWLSAFFPRLPKSESFLFFAIQKKWGPPLDPKHEEVFSTVEGTRRPNGIRFPGWLLRSKSPAFGGRFRQARQRRPFDPVTGRSTIFDGERRRERERANCRRSSIFYSTLPHHSYATRFFQFLFIFFMFFFQLWTCFQFFLLLL